MKNYYRIMLGRKSIYAKDCVAGNFIGADFGIHQDLTPKLSEELSAFNQEFVPIYLQLRPDKTKVAAGLACGTLWRISNSLQRGDIVISPDGERRYHIGEVDGDYVYQPNEILPHRRSVKWFSQTIDRDAMSEALRNSTGSIGTLSDITSHSREIETLIGSIAVPAIISRNEVIEDPAAFAMEEHLEHFLIKNWDQTIFAQEQKYEVYQEDGESGRQYPADKGRIDILAISKDKKTLLVIELKKGRTSDEVVGQILRYMGFVKQELAEEGQSVRGAIVALEDDLKIRRALAIVPDIDFYRYQISFKLLKA